MVNALVVEQQYKADRNLPDYSRKKLPDNAIRQFCLNFSLPQSAGCAYAMVTAVGQCIRLPTGVCHYFNG
ncbi:MAG: hypothetical protein ACTIKR_01635 [Advenella sp.]|uniref:hypothetical protein n=1 Tax=unclassified Advenella TaxID=2685285 RepID=UPI001866CB8E|nr:hypothetical protein [Advenella sp. FME57]